MMTMSKALSAGQAKDYYQQEFVSAKENYYSESGEVRGQWYGRLAEEWGLKGEVSSEQYERLVAGQDPHTGEQQLGGVHIGSYRAGRRCCIEEALQRGRQPAEHMVWE